MNANDMNRLNLAELSRLATQASPVGQALRVLRLPPSVDDPVRIILAAQIQLRRWRLHEISIHPALLQQRVQKIVAAREMLLQRAFALIVPQVGVHSGHECAEHGRRSGRRLGGGRGGLGPAAGRG